ncbi:acetolactate synthase-1/2/3 large subunit [Pseudoxanthobacter soli DSM 19599]|uniref:Acetolactate synthase-1/2/3 large subunit n=2 Tax=Pseudoxanthobacter TaxID=433838 RepID=A0A1M7ZCB9_9HYPH|nr:acetolactate synthase-1/2/3 large subunit [Pseudoxanthobacter soli DSM 19599]
MMNAFHPRTGGRILVDQLLAQGVERVTCVPGESYLAVLDALHDAAIDVVICRNEGGAAMMAEAAGKLTGRPGICFVTRGPGATNASHGVHIAAQDSTPMILFVGQVERGMIGREAFQELDYRAVFGSMAKWVVEIDSAARVPELVARAFRVAMQGRPGPVVVALPEDMLVETAAVADVPRIEPAAPARPDLTHFSDMLAKAENPFVILGGTRWTAEGVAAMVRAAERLALPVGTTFRRADRFPQDHPNYAGDVGIGQNPALTARIKAADLLIVVGTRLSEISTGGYTLVDVPNPSQALVHVHPGAEELGRVYAPMLALQATPDDFAFALDDMKPVESPRWAAATIEANAAYRAWTDAPKALPGTFQYGDVVAWLRERLPADAILTNGAGNYATWLHRYYRHRSFGTQLAPTSGSMGYGVPAAVAAKLAHPERVVVAFAGDGCFLMNGQEFATAVQYQAPIVVVVVDNGMYGTIRMHQEREYPARVSGTRLQNPDFAAYAVAFGGHGERVTATADFAPAFERALESGKPSILHCFIDPDAITPATTLGAIREAALKRHTL